MKKICKSYLRNKNIVFAKNRFATKVTKPLALEDFLRKLHPVSCEKELVRMGPEGDGGYLVPDDLEGIQACFSPGVSSISGFEKKCAELGMQVFLADKSVDSAAEEHERFHFTKKFIGVISDDDFMTLDSWVNDSMPDKDAELLLQIDIEGYEYEVFLATPSDLLRRFRIIVVEFHQLDSFWSRPFFSLASRAFEKILQTHTCLHIHPNNSCGSVKKDGNEIPHAMEFTFLRNDRVTKTGYVKSFPNPLDYKNVPGSDIVLPECWYGGK
jgi:hypothetical protein